MKLKPNGESLANYYGWVCGACFHRGDYWETMLSALLPPPPCVVCGERLGRHQVSAATIAAIFATLETVSP